MAGVKVFPLGCGDDLDEEDLAVRQVKVSIIKGEVRWEWEREK